MRVKTLSSILCLMVSAALAGCPLCTLDEHCPDSLACSNGACVPRNTCERAREYSPPCADGCSQEVDTWGTPTALDPLDLVFVPEGFTQDELETFRQRAHDLVAEMMRDNDSLLRRRPGLFRFHAVLAASATHDLDNPDLQDTLLGGCFQRDTLVAGRPLLDADSWAARELARALVPGAAATVILFNTTHGRANAYLRGGSLRVNLVDDGRVLTHELSHALVGLQDEYAESDQCLPGAMGEWKWGASNVPGEQVDEFFDIPNLTRDSSGAKWGGSAREGGARYASCVYHPTDHCRMQDSAEDYCPVCAAAVERFLDHHAGHNDGPPHCGLRLNQDPGAITEAVYLPETQDLDRPVTFTVSLDGNELAHGAGVSWIGDSQVSAALLRNGGSQLRLDCTDAGGLTSHATLTLHAAH
jgi:hypothetical protein